MLGPALNLDVTLLWGSQLCNELACASLCNERPNCHGADIGRHPRQQQERENGGHQSMPPEVLLQMFFVFLGANGKHHQKPPNFIGALVNLAKHEQDIDMTGLDMNRSYWDGNFNVWAW